MCNYLQTKAYGILGVINSDKYCAEFGHLEAPEDIVQLVLAQVQAQGLQLCPQRVPSAVLACSRAKSSLVSDTKQTDVTQSS